jgi:hypothetical protein
MEKQRWSMRPSTGHGAEKRCRMQEWKAYEEHEMAKRMRRKRKQMETEG